jgi:hypothetical protein
MGRLTQELAEQELARAFIAEEAEEWIGSEEEEELELASIAEEADERTQSEEEDASANASASDYFDASAAFAAAFAAASEEDANARASARASASAGASDSAIANVIASAIASVSACAYFDASWRSAAFAASSTSTSALGARLREKAEDLNEALLEFQAAEGARRKADKEAADTYEAHRLILSKIRRCAKWTASLKVRNLRLQMLPDRVGPGAGAGLHYNLY